MNKVPICKFEDFVIKEILIFKIREFRQLVFTRVIHMTFLVYHFCRYLAKAGMSIFEESEIFVVIQSKSRYSQKRTYRFFAVCRLIYCFDVLLMDNMD